MSWSGSKTDFANQFGAAIKAGAAAIGLFPEIVLAQAFIEGSDANGNMGGGNPMRWGNNVFNIETTPDWQGDWVDANGLKTGTPHWRVYDSIEDSLTDYFKFLKAEPNYATAGVFTATTPALQAQALQNAGYAGSDTAYASKLTSIATDSKTLLDGITGGDEDNEALLWGVGILGAGTLAIVLWPKKTKAIAGLAMNTATKLGVGGLAAVTVAAAVGYYFKDDIEEWYYEIFNPGTSENKGDKEATVELPPSFTQAKTVVDQVLDAQDKQQQDAQAAVDAAAKAPIVYPQSEWQ